MDKEMEKSKRLDNWIRIIEIDQTRGVDIFSLLGLLFIGLKLSDHITWNWFFVLSPIVFKYAVIVISYFRYQRHINSMAKEQNAKDAEHNAKLEEALGIKTEKK